MKMLQCYIVFYENAMTFKKLKQPQVLKIFLVTLYSIWVHFYL